MEKLWVLVPMRLLNNIEVKAEKMVNKFNKFLDYIGTKQIMAVKKLNNDLDSDNYYN